jgi:hypothetical protein
MADQIVLAWEVDAAGTSFGPVQAAAALAAVPLYDNPVTDPVLGQLFGLTVADDTTATAGSTATRTLTLNMNDVNTPEAPPIFPCRPITATPPQLPYTLRRAEPLEGSFFATNGSAVVLTSRSQAQTLLVGDTVEFETQKGVFYTLFGVTGTDITLTAPYTGPTSSTSAARWVLAPVTRMAAYSSSDLDIEAFAGTTPPIPVGPGGVEVELEYMDSTGAGPFFSEANLTGRRPAEFALEVGSIDIAVILSGVVESGIFGGNVGQLTLVELSEDLPTPRPTTTPAEFRGRLTDEAQLLIERAIAYFPPSYFALAQPQASAPMLKGTFFVTTGSKDVPTSVDQTADLSPGDVVQFASQMSLNMPSGPVPVLYTVATVSPKLIMLAAPYTGFNDNNTGVGGRSNTGTLGNLGTEVLAKPTGARRVSPDPAAAPSNDALKGVIAQFVQTATAVPPPNPPQAPATIPVPTFLSGLFTQTLQLALAVPVTPQPITLI